MKKLRKLFVTISCLLLLLTIIQIMPNVESDVEYYYYGYLHKINGTMIAELANYNFTIILTDYITSEKHDLTTDSKGFYSLYCNEIEFNPEVVNYTMNWSISTDQPVIGYYQFEQTDPIDRRIDPTFNINNNLWHWYNDPDPTSCSASPHGDLAIVDIRFSDDNPNENDNVTIYADVKNRGDADISGNIEVSFYNDTDFIEKKIINNLNTNETKDTTVTWKNVVAGYHSITVKIDLVNNFLETREQWNQNRSENIDVWKWISGDWNITNSVNYSDLPILVDGNLYIKSGGNLTLDNCKLKINSSYDGEYKIDVMNNGNFNLDKSTIQPYNTTYSYDFQVNGTMNTFESQIYSPTGNDSTGIGGLKIYSDNVTILNTSILNSKSSGIYINNADPIIKNSYIISNAVNGIYLDRSNATLNNIQVAENCNYGILFNNSNAKLEKSFIHNSKHCLYFMGNSNVSVTNSSFGGHNNFTVNITEDSHPILIIL